LPVPHDLFDAISDPEKQAKQTEQAKITEKNNRFIRFKDIDSEDEIDIDYNIEIKLF
jgi:hypothetical protein